MKKIYLLLSLLVVTAGCEKEELLSPGAEASRTDPTVQEINFKDLPAKLSIHFNDEHYFINKSGKLRGLFGPVNTNGKVQKVNYYKSLSSYTFPLVTKINAKSSRNYYFDNLILKEQADGSVEKMIIRYEPSKEWQDGPRDFQDYSGKIIYFDAEEGKRNEIKMEKGTPLPPKSSSKGAQYECILVLGHTVTVDSGETGGGRTVYYFYSVCGTPSSGNGLPDNGGCTINCGPQDPESIPSVPTEDDPDWDFGSGGGSGAGENPPVEEGEEFKVKNELIDPCASLIFNELLLLSMDHNLPPEVAYNSMNGLQTDLHFSTAILDLFNGFKKFDYIVNKDASLAANTNAQTHYPAVYNPITEKYKITTSFNPDYFEEATDLSMARTMIHESVHAYLIYVLRGEPLGNMKEALDAYIDKNEFPNTFDNQLNHNFMAQYVNAMAYQLQLWDHHHGTGGNLDWQYYQDMAWGGMADYSNPNDSNNSLFYKEFDGYLDSVVENINDEKKRSEKRQEIKERILNTIVNEANNNSRSSQNGENNICQ